MSKQCTCNKSIPNWNIWSVYFTYVERVHTIAIAFAVQRTLLGTIGQRIRLAKASSTYTVRLVVDLARTLH